MTDAQFIVEIRADLAKVKSDIAGLETNASSSGKNAGTAFGSQFAAVVSTILGAISFNKLLGGITQAVSAYKDLELSQIKLKSTIASVNDVNTKNNAILRDGSRSLEERGAALGYTRDQMYKTVTASEASRGATSGLQAQIESMTRAYDESIRPLENSIKAKEKAINANDRESKSINEKIRALREEEKQKLKGVKDSGLGKLEDNNKSIETQIKILENKKLENKIGEDLNIAVVNQNRELDKQINILKLQKSENDLKIDSYQEQIDKIKEATNAQQDQYQSELNDIQVRKNALLDSVQEIKDAIEAKKATFDINIEPLKNKLKDLQLATSGGGSSQVFDPDIARKIEEESKKGPKTINEEDVSRKVEELYNRFGGLVSRQALGSAFNNLILKGLTDVDKMAEGVGRYVDAASQGKSANIDLDTAVVNLSDAFRRNNSVLGDASGITENYSELQKVALDNFNKENGLQEKKFDNLTKEQQAQYLLQAQLDKTIDRQGGFSRALESGLLGQEKFNASLLVLQQTLGGVFNEDFQFVIGKLAEFVKYIGDFVEKNKELTKGLAIAALAFTALLTVISFILIALPALTVMFAAITSPIGLVAIAIGITIFKFWEMRDVVFNVVNTIYNQVTGTFSNITRFVLFWLPGLLGLFALFKWDNVWSGMFDAFKNTIINIGSWFGKLSWSNLLRDGLNSMKNIIRDMFVNILKVIPGTDGIREAITQGANAIRFADGGRPTGSNVLSLLNDGVGRMSGQETVINAPATSAFAPLLDMINAIGRGDTYNQQSQTNINYGTSPVPLSAGFEI